MYGSWNTGGGGRAQRNGRVEQRPSQSKELKFCIQERICYKFNRLQCFLATCKLGRHICKRCWAVEGSIENHASDNKDECRNMSPDYLKSLENDSAGDDVMQYSESEHENHEEVLRSTPGDVYQSSRRGHLSFHSQPSGPGCSSQSIERGRNPTSQGSGRGYNSPLIERGRNQMSQPSGRGGSSHFVERGQNQPSGRGGSSQRGRNQTYQASGRGGNIHPIQHGRNETSQPSEHGDHSRQPIQALDLSTSGTFLRQPPQPPLEHDSQEALEPKKNTSESEALMAIREENLNLKEKIIATRSDLVDEKYQHQMLQVRYAELEKKCKNLGEENTHLRTMLEKNREMQRLFPVFMKNSSTNQNQYEEDENDQYDDNKHNENVYESGDPNFDLFGGSQNNDKSFF